MANENNSIKGYRSELERLSADMHGHIDAALYIGGRLVDSNEDEAYPLGILVESLASNMKEAKERLDALIAAGAGNE